MSSAMIQTLLIANRGEIACRVIRTAKRLGVRTIAVYSDADAHAMHVAQADHALRLGPSPAVASYLNVERLLECVAISKADAVHPGYGFLSENDDFADALSRIGVTFVGPPASAIRAMGSKSAALELMSQAGVPVLPGYRGSDQSIEALSAAAENLGFPLLVKPVAGGGGKGMRIVTDATALEPALKSAQREAIAAFGDGDLLLERYLERARHVEVQVFADTHGRAVHLFERDCSIQRRHQKVLEEAPAPGLNAELRARMGEVAVRAAEAISYVGAGTIEFLLDPDAISSDGDPFYFMEMNTRLQVEHPVTEMVLGIDLVEWQLRVASGQPLPDSFGKLEPSGHAIEARIYAEDPARGFLPASGRLYHLRAPEDHVGIRIDTGVRQGDDIGVYYDPMIAKLIAHGATRNEAIRRLRRALENYEILGVNTNVEFLCRIAALPAYAAGELDTGFIPRFKDTLFAPGDAAADQDAIIMAALHLALSRAQPDNRKTGETYSPWSRLPGFRLNADSVEYVRLEKGDQEYCFSVRQSTAGMEISDGSSSRQVRAELDADGGLRARVDDRRLRATGVYVDELIYLWLNGRAHVFSVVNPDERRLTAPTSQGHLTAPMPGKIIAVLVEAGASVSRGQALVTMEAMKMEHTISAPFDGVVESVRYGVGDLVTEGADLIHITAQN